VFSTLVVNIETHVFGIELNKGLLSALLVIVIVASALTGYAVGSNNRASVTVTSTLTTNGMTSCPVALGQSGAPEESVFPVEISYQGYWNATVRTYSAAVMSPPYLTSTCNYHGGGTQFIYVVPWNMNGWQTVSVVTTKLDSSNGNLTASVGWGAALKSNSTTLPHGSVSTFISVVP
jgi:hypothetical protein